MILNIFLMHRYPTIPAAAAASRLTPASAAEIPEPGSCVSSSTAAPKMDGTASRNEYLTENFLLNPYIRHTAMVMPHREIPGNTVMP